VKIAGVSFSVFLLSAAIFSSTERVGFGGGLTIVGFTSAGGGLTFSSTFLGSGAGYLDGRL